MVLVLSFFGLDVSLKESTILCCDMLRKNSWTVVFFFFLKNVLNLFHIVKKD